MTIKRRIALASAAAVAVTVLVVSVGSYLGARAQIMGPIDDSLAARAEVYREIPRFGLSGFVDVGPDGIGRGRGFGLPRELGSLFGRGTPVDFDATYVQIIQPTAIINIGDGSLELPPPRPHSLESGVVHFRSQWVDGTHIRIATIGLPEQEAVVQVGRPLTEADETLRRFAWMLAVASAFGILLAGGLGLLVARNAVRPIGELEASVSEIANAKRLGNRIDVKGSDEVAQLAMAFNTLLGELESAKVQQTRLVRDAGHELRTPLTALRTNIEILQRHEVDPDERLRMLNAVHAEVEELTDLVAEVVDLATDRYEEEPISTVLLSEVVEAVAERQSRRNGRVVVIDADDSCVEGKPSALERAVANIVSNAGKWSPADTEIRVTVLDGTVTVQDSGQGFNDVDIDHVFDRFYRSDDARAMPGSGLGLSIVDQIVTDHAGSVFAGNRDGEQGAEVGFTLPTGLK
jgi:two-component system sensor histidine kinase MprB